VSGIGFAVLFMFMQLGFLATVENTARVLTDRLAGDVLLLSPRLSDLRRMHGVPRARLVQAASVPGVESVVPLYVRFTVWRTTDRARRCEMLALGVSLEGPSPLTLPELAQQGTELRRPEALLVDVLTQPKCGPTGIGAESIVNDRRRMVVGGRYQLGVGFQADGSFIVGEGAFYELFGGHRLEQAQIGVVRVRPGFEPEEVALALARRLPDDTRVATRAEFASEQVRFWVDDTAIGNMFLLGTVVGFVVGVVILYQVLSTDIRNQLPQFATLKAMGYRDRQLFSFVLQQSWVYALLGYVPGAALALGVYLVGREMTLLPLFMTAGRAVGVLVLSALMCTGAALLSLRKLAHADPAELF